MDGTLVDTRKQLVHLWRVTNEQPNTDPYWSSTFGSKSGGLTQSEVDDDAKSSLNTDGPDSSEMAKNMAVWTIPMIIHGMSEQIDPCIRNMKSNDITRTWSSFFDNLILPITMYGIPPFGIGTHPPITPLGIAALSMPLPAGEKTPDGSIFDVNSGDDSQFKADEYTIKNISDERWAAWFNDDHKPV